MVLISFLSFTVPSKPPEQDEVENIKVIMPRDLKAKHTRKNAEKKKYLVEEADDKGRSEDVDWKLGIKLN